MIKHPLHQGLPLPPRPVAQRTLSSLFDIHPWDRLAVLHRYRGISLVVFALTSAAIVIQGYTSVQLFEARGRLLIESERSAALPFQSSAPTDADAQTSDAAQYRMIEGRDLARRVVQQLHLENHPEFNGTADPPRTPLAWLAGLTRRFVVLVQHGSTDGEPPRVAAAADEASPIDRFVALVGVKRVPGTRLVDVTFQSMDAQLAALAVNTLMDGYVAQNAAPPGAATPGTPDTAADSAPHVAPHVASASRVNNVQISERADIPTRPTSPGRPWTWLLALAIGLGSSMVVAFGLDYMNDTIGTPEDIAARLKLPLLGLIPTIRSDTDPLLASSYVRNDFGESFRTLRASVLSTYAEAGTKLLIVTSTQRLEGRTMVAANLATALADGGARVLLIDADMRRPGLHVPFGLTNERGLAQVLNGRARLRDVIQRTADPNLLAIPTGRLPQNPSELLSSERMNTLLVNLASGAFDWIVIDTPPVLAFSDAVILAPSVAGIVYVIGAEMTQRRLAERALTTIRSARPRSVCAVLNNVDFTRHGQEYSHYSSRLGAGRT